MKPEVIYEYGKKPYIPEVIELEPLPKIGLNELKESAICIAQFTKEVAKITTKILKESGVKELIREIKAFKKCLTTEF